MAREKISADFKSLEFFNFLNTCLTKSRNNQILLNKIGHRFLLTTKLFTGQKVLINLICFTLQTKDNLEFT
jgi:hypothetical protein